jgi:hypothetical protein
VGKVSRRKKEEGRRKKEEGIRKEEAILAIVSAVKNIFAVNSPLSTVHCYSSHPIPEFRISNLYTA